MIVDYGMGNLRSVANAFEALGCSVEIAKRPEELAEADRIILPGVGAFGDGMRNLAAGGWVDVLEKEIKQKGKPLLAICLGMQLLATTGTEHGVRPGLGWIPGIVERLHPGEPALRIPHIGWNDVAFIEKDGLFAELGETKVFYFVHSYVFRPEEPSVISGTCHYGQQFAAGIEKDNICATQFHPEKSQKAGLAVLRNFLSLRG